jgi:lysophospholipase L1-like esterase
MISAQSKHWQLRVNQFSQEIKSTPKGKIVFLGNSVTEGFDLTAAFPKTRPINRGIISDHLDGVMDRIDSSVVVLQPSQLFILIGINDIGRGDTDSLIISRYRTLLSRLHLALKSTKIYLVSILPTSVKWSNCPKEKIERINQHISDLAKEYNCEWMDINHLFADANGYLKDKFSPDGLHLNTVGYEIWIKELQKLGLE